MPAIRRNLFFTLLSAMISDWSFCVSFQNADSVEFESSSTSTTSTSLQCDGSHCGQLMLLVTWVSLQSIGTTTNTELLNNPSPSLASHMPKLLYRGRWCISKINGVGLWSGCDCRHHARKSLVPLHSCGYRLCSAAGIVRNFRNHQIRDLASP